MVHVVWFIKRCNVLLCKAINGYRETEKRDWNDKNKSVLQRVRSLAFTPDVVQLEYVHVLDVLADGVIKAHIDSTRVSYLCSYYAILIVVIRLGHRS